ncbi:hypothetical protein BCR43DRAFT_492046 [Syncephalastrum racemosum]|uniref:Transmembrane protein n=1 Tax=Syncephalastrum racemosum TaxID=13706 RepID=A0A1X2HCX6_SYNRA|nr:hypothetical protein BCR43DRAFT_492046 [Syncephalastrum racemosum]
MSTAPSGSEHRWFEATAPTAAAIMMLVAVCFSGWFVQKKRRRHYRTTLPRSHAVHNLNDTSTDLYRTPTFYLWNKPPPSTAALACKQMQPRHSITQIGSWFAALLHRQEQNGIDSEQPEPTWHERRDLLLKKYGAV